MGRIDEELRFFHQIYSFVFLDLSHVDKIKSPYYQQNITQDSPPTRPKRLRDDTIARSLKTNVMFFSWI